MQWAYISLIFHLRLTEWVFVINTKEEGIQLNYSFWKINLDRILFYFILDLCFPFCSDQRRPRMLIPLCCAQQSRNPAALHWDSPSCWAPPHLHLFWQKQARSWKVLSNLFWSWGASRCLSICFRLRKLNEQFVAKWDSWRDHLLWWWVCDSRWDDNFWLLLLVLLTNKGLGQSAHFTKKHRNISNLQGLG